MGGGIVGVGGFGVDVDVGPGGVDGRRGDEGGDEGLVVKVGGFAAGDGAVACQPPFVRLHQSSTRLKNSATISHSPVGSPSH